jgi:hypothetical protein
MFAATKSAAGLKPITQTFTSNTTWVAPVNVSNLITVTGQGGDGTPGYWEALFNPLHYVQQTLSSGSPATLDWGPLYSSAQSAIVALNSGGALARTAPNNIPFVFYFINPSDVYIPGANYTGLLNGKTIRGTATLGITGSPLTSGQVLYSQLSVSFIGWFIDGTMEVFVDATVGASTTAFGYTFPGGTGGAATPVTYSNVAVTPGASYPIVVPAGGSVSITYIG